MRTIEIDMADLLLFCEFRNDKIFIVKESEVMLKIIAV